MSSSTEISGIHAGFFWKIDSEAAIYLTEEAHFSPFDNPKFAEAFQKAGHIAFDFFSQEKLGTNLSEKILITLAQATEKYFSSDEIAQCNQILETLIAVLPTDPLFDSTRLEKRENPREQFVSQLAFYVLASLSPVRMEENLVKNQINQKAQESNKLCSSLLSHSEQENLLSDIPTILFKLPSFYPIIKKFFLSQEGMGAMRAYRTEIKQAWNFGAISVYEGHKITLPSEVSEEIASEMNAQYKDEPTYHKLLEQDKKILAKIASRMFSFGTTVADRIADTLKQHPNTLFIAQAGMQQQLFLSLAERKIQLHGPLRESIKPRGFLWKITKTDPKLNPIDAPALGYFSASVHITPQWILDNVNSATLKAFDECDVLGVEVDITREDVKNQMSQEELAYAEEQEEMFVAIVKEGLQEYGLTCNESNPKDFIQKGFAMVQKAIFAKHGTESGLDLLFIAKAKERKISIIDLESVETHMEFLQATKRQGLEGAQKLATSTTEDAQESTLTAKELYQGLKQYYQKEILGSYPEILEMGYTQPLEMQFNALAPEIQELVNYRNLEMAQSVHKCIRKGKKLFAVEGALHYAGPQSTLKLMGPLGYTITQIFCEEPL